jgi:hypothetical protein
MFDYDIHQNPVRLRGKHVLGSQEVVLLLLYDENP